MKNDFILALPLLLLATSSAAVNVKTSIDVQAQIDTSVRVYVEGRDVTNGNISLELKEADGYMYGITPAFHFVGNASQVSIRLNEPAGKDLISDKGDRMHINTAWMRPDGGLASTSYNYRQTVYPSIETIPDTAEGVKVQFKSAYGIATYALGTYSGVYEVVISPMV